MTTSQTLKIALAQLNPVVGDLSGNAKKALNAHAEAKRGGADVIVPAGGHPALLFSREPGLCIGHAPFVNSVAVTPLLPLLGEDGVSYVDRMTSIVRMQ